MVRSDGESRIIIVHFPRETHLEESPLQGTSVLPWIPLVSLRTLFPLGTLRALLPFRALLPLGTLRTTFPLRTGGAYGPFTS